MLRAAALAILASACGQAAVQVRTGAIVSTSDLDEVPASPLPPTPPDLPPPTVETGSAGSAATPVAPAPPVPAEQPMVFGLLDGEMALEEAWDRWRAGKTTTFDGVFEIAVLANRARPLEMSDELMVIALARAVELSGCDPERLGKIRLLAIAVSTAAHPPELDGELTRLSDMGPTECAKP